MKKRFAFTMLIVLCMVILLFAFPVSAAKEPATSGSGGENITWNFDANTGTLTFSGTGEMIDGINHSWRKLDDVTTSVVIGEGITSIGSSAFTGFHVLEAVTLPDSLQTVGGSAFSCCWVLKTINGGKNITALKDSAFQGCGSLTDFTIPAGVTELSRSLFSGCSSLSNIIIHDNITVINNYVFSDCYALTSVVIPDCVTDLGSSTFYGCKNLTSISIGKGVTKIGDNTFAYCTGLTEFVIPDTITEISGYAFSHCFNLEKITIGAGVTHIKNTAFWYSDKLHTITVSPKNSYFYADQGVLYRKEGAELFVIPHGFVGKYTVLPGTTKIHTYAAYECVNLTAISIPESVTLIEDYAFFRCSGLQSVTFEYGLEKLEFRSFAYCSSLKEVVIPASVKEIHGDVFEDSTNLTSITFRGDAPQISEYAFSGIKATAYFPGENASWTKAQKHYSGTIDWVALTCSGEHTIHTVAGRPATCTQSGLSEGSSCDYCGKTFSMQTTIPAAGHSYGSWITVSQPTIYMEGQAKRICSVCGNVELKTQAKLPPEQTGTQQPALPPETQEPLSGETQPESTGSTEPEETLAQLQPEAQAPTGEDMSNPGKTNSAVKIIIIVVIGILAVVGGSYTVIFMIQRKKI